MDPRLADSGIRTREVAAFQLAISRVRRANPVVRPVDEQLLHRPDVAEVAFRVFQEAIGEAPKTLPPNERTEKNADAVKRGAKGERRAARSAPSTLLRRSVRRRRN